MVEGFTRKTLVGLAGIDRNVTEIPGRNLTIYIQQCGGIGYWVSSDITFWRPCCPHGIAGATSTPPAQPDGFGATCIYCGLSGERGEKRRATHRICSISACFDHIQLQSLWTIHRQSVGGASGSPNALILRPSRLVQAPRAAPGRAEDANQVKRFALTVTCAPMQQGAKETSFGCL